MITTGRGGRSLAVGVVPQAASEDRQKLPVGYLSTLEHSSQTEKLARRKQFRTITVSAFPAAGRAVI